MSNPALQQRTGLPGAAHRDYYARAMAAGAVLFAALSCYFAYTSSPHYRGDLPQLNYYYQQVHQGRQPDGRFAGAVDVYVRNDSSHPAREVFVCVNTYDDPAPQISASTEFTLHDTQPGQKLIKLDLVPARGLAHVSIKTNLRELADDANPFPFKPWLEAPSVAHVYTEHGWIPCRHDECRRNFVATSPHGNGGRTQVGGGEQQHGSKTVQQAAQEGLLINGGSRQ